MEPNTEQFTIRFGSRRPHKTLRPIQGPQGSNLFANANGMNETASSNSGRSL